MATVSVTCIKDGRSDKFGRPLVSGSSYTIDYDLAFSLWEAGYISVANASIFNGTSQSFWLRNSIKTNTKMTTNLAGSLLASLAASSTATRVGLVVTVASTSHGIPATVYDGAMFYFPGCSSLPAGWYSDFLYVSANAIQFSLNVGTAGSDFAGESVNGGSAYTTQTSIYGITIPAKTLQVGSVVTMSAYRACGTTSAAKLTYFMVDGLQVGRWSGTNTAASGLVRMSIFCDVGGVRSVSFSTDVATHATASYKSINYESDIVFSLEQSIGAAGGFVYYPPCALIEIVQ